MAEDDAEIIVSLETEGAGGITKVEPARDEAGKFVAKETEPSEDLAAQFRAEAESAKNRADAAERQGAIDRQDADKARREAAAARTEASDSQLDTVSTGLAAAQTEADAATAAYQSAMEAGDFAAAAKAQRRMASAEAKIGRLDEAKADLEARKVERPTERTERTETKPNTDPVEAYLATRTEPTAKWLRDHRDYLTDPKKNAKLIAAHHDAISEDIALDSTKYFAHIEQFVGLKKAEPEAKTNATTPAKRRSTVPVAPVQQSGGSAGPGGTEVRLSQREATAAQDGTHVWNYDDPSPQKRFKKGDPLGIQEFARRKSEMTKKGLYDRTFTEA